MSLFISFHQIRMYRELPENAPGLGGTETISIILWFNTQKCC